MPFVPIGKKQKMIQKKAGFITNFIFDVDGTLWDTTEIVAEAWNRALTEIGGLPAELTPAILKREFGKTMEVIADDLFPEASKSTKLNFMQKCCEQEHIALASATDQLLYPGVKETIKRLSEKCCLFIVSNCQSGYVELFLEKSGLGPYIEDFECYGNTGNGKGENIRLLMERNHLQEAFYLGDTQGDCEASASAGVPFLFARYGFGDVTTFHRAIDSFGELLDFC